MKLVTRALPWILGAYLVAMTVITLSGIGHLSYYFDEIFHLQKLNNFLEYGQYGVLSVAHVNGHAVNHFQQTYIYGPFFSLTAHAVATLLGAETWSSPQMTDAAFTIRHYVVAVMSLVGTFAAGWGVKLVTRSVTWGLAAAALLMSIPMWSGAALFDVKDVPFGMGFTLLTAACISLSRDRHSMSRASVVGGWIAMFAGTTATWGMRPGMWVAVVLNFVAMAIIHAKLTNFASWRTTLRSLVFPATAVVASYLLMVVVYPAVFGNPVMWLAKSLFASSGFSHDDIVLTDGEHMHMPPPWYYIPKWLGAQLPELIALLGALSIVAVIALLAWRLTKKTPQIIDDSVPGMAFPFIQFTAFPIAAILVHAQITSGLRQFLFIIPALIMMITIMLFWAKKYLDARSIRVVWPTTVAVLAASTVLTSVIQVQLSPFQFNYFNPTTMARGVNGNWEIYAVKLSSGELYAGLTPEERAHCDVRCPALNTFPESFRASTAQSDTTIAYWQSIHFPKTRNAIDPKTGCSGIASAIERPYLWGRFTVAVTDLCQMTAHTIDHMHAAAKTSRQWWHAISRWGWTTISDSGLESTPGEHSALAWLRTDDQLDATTTNSVTVTVNSGSASTVNLVTTVNGVPGTPETIAVGQTVTIPVVAMPVTDASIPKALVVVEFSLTDASGKPVSNTLTVSSFR